MKHTIPLTPERHSEALTAIEYAMAKGGKLMTISDIDSDRSAAQNALCWSWNREIAKAEGHTQDWVHGETKMRLLLPLYKGWGSTYFERANFIEQIMERVPSHKHRIFVCYDSLRTRNLSIKKMAEYLTVMQRDAAERGIILESNEDLEFKSQARAA